jgi:hypothetical protein
MGFQKVWLPIDLGTLIAWLDFCIQTQTDFDSTISERLKESREHHGETEYGFTLKPVHDKIIDLARRNTVPKDAPRYPGKAEIYLRGSVCFPGLSAELKRRADKSLAHYQAFYGQQIENRNVVQYSNRATRPQAKIALKLNAGTPRNSTDIQSNGRNLSELCPRGVKQQKKVGFVPDPRLNEHLLMCMILRREIWAILQKIAKLKS